MGSSARDTEKTRLIWTLIFVVVLCETNDAILFVMVITQACASFAA